MAESRSGNRRKRLRNSRPGGSSRRCDAGTLGFRALRYECLEERQLLSAVNPVGAEFQVNTYVSNAQDLAQTAIDSNGDYVVVWQSNTEDGSGYGIYAQRYNAAGTALGNEFRVNTYTTSAQTQPAIAMDAAGDFVVTWDSFQDGSNQGIYAQRYSPTGVAQGTEFRVNSYTVNAQRRPAIAMDSVGDFVITWQSTTEDGSVYGIYAQRYSNAGITQGSEFRVNTYTTGNQEFPAVAMDAGGDFVVTWSSFGEDGSGYGVYAQRYNSGGTTQGSEFRINTYTANDQTYSSVHMDATGDFVVAWTSYGEDGSGAGIYARLYSSGGAAQTSEFRVNTYTTGNQNLSSVSMDSSGDFVVSWASYGEDGGGYGVYAQYYASGGTAVGGEFRVNTTGAGNQGGLIPGFKDGAPSVALGTGGNFTIAWSSALQDGSSYGVYAQRFQLAIVAPVVQINPPTNLYALAYTVQSGPQALDPFVTVTDSDSQTLASATVTIASGYLTPQDNLLFTNQNGIFGTFNPITGAMVLLGTASVAQYQQALESISYTNISMNPSFTQRIVSITVNDGATSSSPANVPINVFAGPATQLAISNSGQPPATVTSGGAFGLSVEVEDAFGNAVTTYQGNLTIALNNNPGLATLGGVLVEPVNNTFNKVSPPGFAVFTGLTLDNTGAGYTLVANGGTLTPVTSNGITVVLGPAIKTGGGSLTYGVQTGIKTIDPNLTFVDPESNTILSATVAIASGFAGAQDVLTYANQNGILGSYNATSGTLILTGAATVAQYQTALQSISYTNTALNPSFTPRIVTYTAYDGFVSSPPAGFTINVIPGPATQLIISSNPPGTVSAGVAFGLTVTAEDFYNNFASGFSGTVSITLANNPTLTTLAGTLSVNAVNGQAVFSNLVLSKPGIGYSLNAGGNMLTGATTSTFDVVAGVPKQLVLLSEPPSTVTAGSPFQFTVAAEDSVGNIASGYTGNVAVALVSNPVSPNILSGTLSLSMSAGEAVFTGLSLSTANTGNLLRVSSSTLKTATSSSIAVTPAATAILAIRSQPSTVVAGTTFGVTVVAEDIFGNLTNYTGSVTAAISNNPGNSTLGGTLTANASSGVATFTTLTLNKVGTGYSLVFNSDDLATGTTGNIRVVPGTASQLIATAPPANVTVTAPFGLTVEALDAEGNVASGFSGKVTAAIGNNPGGATLTGGATVTAASGLAVFSGLSLDNAGFNYTLVFTSTGVTPATSNTFNVTPAFEAIQLAITSGQPSTVTAGTPFLITVDAEDGFGRTDPNFNSTITLALGTNPGSSTLGGTLTATASSGVAVFSTLTLNKVDPGYTLVATTNSVVLGTSTTLASGTTKAITVIPGAATQLIVAGGPPSTTPVFTDFSLSVVAEDAEGNLATSFSGTMTVALTGTGAPTGATLGGTLAVDATNGLAVFSDLTVNLVGTGYVLQVTSPGLTAATTSAFSAAPATLTITGAADDVVMVTFTDPTDFSVTVNAGAPTSYSTLAYDKLVYNGLTGGGSSVIFSDPNTSDQYTATQSLASTILTNSGGNSFEFDANSVSDLYIYVSDPSSTATVNVTGGTGNNFYVDAANLGYSYIADPILLIYSELAGFGSQTVSGSGGTTYAYVYSTSHAIVVGDPGQTTISYGSVTTSLSNFAQLYTVGATDGTDNITLHTGGGAFVGTPSFSYVSGTSNGQQFLIGALYCATVTTFATNPTDLATFYSYSGNTFNGSSINSELMGSTAAYADAAGIIYSSFISQAENFQSVAVFESGTGKDVANLTATGNSVLTTMPDSSILAIGGVTVITVDTYFNNNGTNVAVLARINATGTSTDTANLYDSVGANSLVAKTNVVTLVTPVNTVAVKQFGTVNAYASSGTSDTASEQAVDIALSTIGNWTIV